MSDDWPQIKARLEHDATGWAAVYYEPEQRAADIRAALQRVELYAEQARLTEMLSEADTRYGTLVLESNRLRAEVARLVGALGALLDHGDEDAARAALAAVKGE